MAGLVPAIHVFWNEARRGCRHKAGHDETAIQPFVPAQARTQASLILIEHVAVDPRFRGDERNFDVRNQSYCFFAVGLAFRGSSFGLT